MRVEILGPGCWKCRQLEANARKVLQELGIAAKIEKITDIGAISERVSMTPAIAVNGKIMAEGRIPDVDEIKKWLK